MNELVVKVSPHIRDNISTNKIMTHFLIALIPAIMASIYIFGIRSAYLIFFCMITAVIWERLCNLIMKRPNSTGDLSAAVTGVLLSFTLPTSLPYWMAAIGTFVAIVIAKQLFGGLGKNLANPAVVGQIVLSIAFPTAMTSWIMPTLFNFDSLTLSTPLSTGNADYNSLFLGFTTGALGEVCASALLFGGFYLIAIKVILPHIPFAFLGTIVAFSYLTGRDGLFQLLAGGAVLGAFFIATDFVTSPITRYGKIIFGIGCGLITCIIRFWSPFEEGVYFAILIMNFLTPLIDKITQIKPVGTNQKKQVSEV